MKVAILLFEEVDLLDVDGAYEVLLTANRLAARQGLSQIFEVVTVSAGGVPVAAHGGLKLIPHAALNHSEEIDLFIVPGSINIDDVANDPVLMGEVHGAVARASLVASVCTGAFLLAELGFLDDRPWTTHWEDVDFLSARLPSQGIPWARWVDSGEVITSGGLSSGIAMALHIVDRIAGRELATGTARQLEYKWDPERGIRLGRSGDTTGPGR